MPVKILRHKDLVGVEKIIKRNITKEKIQQMRM